MKWSWTWKLPHVVLYFLIFFFEFHHDTAGLAAVDVRVCARLRKTIQLYIFLAKKHDSMMTENFRNLLEIWSERHCSAQPMSAKKRQEENVKNEFGLKFGSICMSFYNSIRQLNNARHESTRAWPLLAFAPVAPPGGTIPPVAAPFV